jgi:hypothetical protein
MKDIYDDLLENLSTLKDADEETSGMDDYLAGQKIVKVASMDDLFSFLRIGNDTLIHKSKKDLWKISENNGDVVIERLFDPETDQPLRI